MHNSIFIPVESANYGNLKTELAPDEKESILNGKLFEPIISRANRTILQYEYGINNPKT